MITLHPLRRLALAAAVCTFGLGGSALAEGRLLSLSKQGATLHVYDAESFEPQGTFKVGNGPHEVVTDGTGRFAYVANYGDQQPGSTMTVVDLEEGNVVTTIDLGALARPHGLAEHNGKIYFTSEVAKAVGRIDVKTNKVDWIAGTGQGITHMLAVSPMSGEIYTADITGGTVTVINPSGPPPASVTRIDVPGQPEGIAVSPDGKFVAVGDNQGGAISLIDANTRQIVGTIETGGMPIRVGFTPDGQRLLATDPKAGVLRVYDFETREQAGEVELGGQPIGFVVNPKMNTVLVSLAQAGEVAEVDLAKLTVKRRLKTGPVPDGIALVMVAGRAEVAQAAAGADPQDPMPDGPAGRKPRLGVILEPTFDGEGVQIAQVTPATLAEQVGLQAGDVVLSIDGTPITDPQQMAKLVFDANPGQTLKFRIVRKGQELDVAVKLH